MKIALAQISSTPDPAENLRLLEASAREAAERGAEIVLFPEAAHRSVRRPSVAPSLLDAAEPPEGPWAQRVREIAREAEITIVVGMYTTASEDRGDSRRVRNTLLAAGPEVDVAYDKIHLYDAFGYTESDSVEPGLEPRTFTIGGITFGLATCYDLRFPQLFQHYAHAGTAAVLVAASWAPGEVKIHQWQTLVAARALDSTCYVIACDQADPSSEEEPSVPGDPIGIGYSAVAGPEGEEIVSAGPDPELLIADIAVERVEQARERIPVLANAVSWPATEPQRHPRSDQRRSTH